VGQAVVTDDLPGIHPFYLKKLEIHLEIDAEVDIIYLLDLI
jgi:hypothetical protein